MNRAELVRRHGLWLVFVVAAIVYFHRFAQHGQGMALYPLGGDCVLRQQALKICAPMFTYPPAFAFTMIPFALVSDFVWNLGWYLITLAATILSYRLAEALARQLVPGPWLERDLIRLRLISLVLSLKFILSVYENQAYDLFVLPPILYGLLCLTRGRDLAGGASLAVAAALKATPLLFLPYLLLRRRFAAALGFTVIFLGASFLPDLFFTQAGGSSYFAAWLRNIAAGALDEGAANANTGFFAGTNILNHSIHGAVARLVDGTFLQADFPLVLRAVQLLFVAIVGLLLLRSARRPDTIPAEGALVLIAMLMLSPMTSRSHYVSLLLPYTLLSAYWLRDRRTKGVGLALLALSFLLATATSNDLVGSRVTTWAYRNNLIELGALIMIPYLAIVIWPRKERAEAGELRETVPSA
jgi:uncharacterized membrane protein